MIRPVLVLASTLLVSTLFMLQGCAAGNQVAAPRSAGAPPVAAKDSVPSKGSGERKDSDASHSGPNSLSARLNLAADQALYKQEYVRRRAFPDTTLRLIGAIPGPDLRRILRGRWPIRPPVFLTDAAPCQWMPGGPTNVPGRVTGIAVTKQPATPGTPRVIVTTVGGVWRSMDGGRRWERVSDFMKPGVFGAVGVTPGVPGEVFVGGGDPNYFDPARAGGPGIWLSTSGGDATSWRMVGPPELDNAVIFRFQIDPAGNHDVYVATSQGVYHGDRSSATIAWKKLQGASKAFDAPTSDIAVHFPAGGTPIVYAGAYESSMDFGAGIWKFTGSPVSGQWVRRSTGISPSAGVIHLAFAPSNPQILYAKVSNETNHSLLAIYKTTTAAETAAPRCTDPNSSCVWCNIKRTSDAAEDLVNDSYIGDYRYDYYNGAIAVHPTNPDIVFIGNKRLFWTDTGCAPWFDLSQSLEVPFRNEGVAIHDDQHALAFDPDDPDYLWVGGDGGVYRSSKWTTSPTQGFGRWEPRSHGMTTTEFWGVGTQQANVTPLLGGMQDNGTGVTYGNRTWYAYYTCDGAQASLDAANSARVYQSCNGNMQVIKTILPNLEDAWEEVPPVSGATPLSPLAVDPFAAGHIVSAGVTAADKACITTTTDARNWSAGYQLPDGMEVSCLAIAPPPAPGCAPLAPFSVFYAGLRSVEGTTPRTAILYTVNSGTTWQSAASGVPLLSPNAIAVDRCDSKRAFAAFGGNRGQSGQVRITTDGGANWTDLPFPAGWPGAPATAVAIDPFNPDVIYAGTAIGVYRGTVTRTSPPSCAWTRFNEGLPIDASGTVGLDVTSIDVNAKTGTLVLGTMGYGAFQRDIRTVNPCRSTRLTIRDNVFDRGQEPSPAGEPDPEHPICENPPACDTYRPDATPGLQWWNSPDIRVEVRCPAASASCTCPRSPIEPEGELDAVEVESCPTASSTCPAFTMVDRNPTSGCQNRVYVQVTNRGPRRGNNLRVMALWTHATTILPQLPATFWSSTFPASGSCASIDESTGWHLVDPANPCKTISALDADRPQVVYFDWSNPPANACLMTLVESADDPIPGSVRTQFAPRSFVKSTHQIGVRNLNLVDAKSQVLQVAFLDSLSYRNAFAVQTGQKIVISRDQLDLRDTVGILLPKTPGLAFVGMDTSSVVKLTADERARAHQMGLDTTRVYRVRPPQGMIAGLSVPPGGAWPIGVRLRTATGSRKIRSPQFTVTAMKDSVVLGGSTYMLRFPP